MFLSKTCLSKYEGDKGVFLCIFYRIRKMNILNLIKRRKRAVEGSLTIEAAIALSMYIFAVITLTLPMERLDVHRKVQQALETEAKTISIDAYREDITGKDYKPLAITTTELTAGNRLDTVWAWKTGVSEDGEWIVLDVKADMTLPFPVFNIRSIPVHVVSRRHLWNGVPGGRLHKKKESGKDVKEVYVGKNSTRYHISSTCHYLYHNPVPVSKGQISELRNESGKKYKACDRCGNTDTTLVYVLPEGESYHSVSDCSSMRSYVKKVKKSTVEHLGPCSYCSGG